jgi:hypothetical protein
LPAALGGLERLGRVHDRDVDARRVEQALEPRPIADGDDLGVLLGIPAPALEGHHDRAVVGVAVREHAPAPAAQLLAPREARSRADVGCAAADRRGDDHDVGAVAEVDRDDVGRHGVGELRLTGDECGQRLRVSLVEAQLGVEPVLLEVAALDGGEER